MTGVVSQIQKTNDQMNALVVLIVYFMYRWRLLKPVLESSHSHLPVKSLLCEKKCAVSSVLLNQENSRNYELKLRQTGLKFTSLKLPCVL